MTNHDDLVPDFLNTDRQYDRFYHFDLPTCDDTDVVDELNYLRALLWGAPLHHWVRQRVAALESELRKRSGVDSGRARHQGPEPTGVIPL